MLSPNPRCRMGANEHVDLFASITIFGSRLICSDDFTESKSCHSDYILVQPEFMGAALSWEYGGAPRLYVPRMFTNGSTCNGNIGAEIMTKHMKTSRLACMTTALATGVVLIASASIASAKGDHHQGNNVQSNGASPHFVISGQPANVKRVLSNKKTKEKTKEKYTDKKPKGCKGIIVPTAECGVSSKNPVGSTQPTLPVSSGGSTATKGPSLAYTPVTVSNGVTSSAIFNGKGLMITSTTPGTITVSNGTNSVTMPGGSLTLHGAVSVSVSSGVQLVRQPNGDVAVAVSPVIGSAPAKPTAGANNGPPGVTFADDLKALGKTAGNGAALVVTSPIVIAGAAAVELGAVVVGTAAGHPIQYAKEVGNEVVNDAGKVIEWVSGWF